jgi:hypothetical protein
MNARQLFVLGASMLAAALAGDAVAQQARAARCAVDCEERKRLQARPASRLRGCLVPCYIRTMDAVDEASLPTELRLNWKAGFSGGSRLAYSRDQTREFRL